MKTLLACLCLAAPVHAAPLPTFAQCMAQEMARFERALGSAKDTVSVLGISGVDYCGSVGIVGCDRTGKPIGCQVRLAKQQEALKAEVLAALPPVGEDAFYARLYQLAHGTSAGPDCSGATAPMLAWCMAWEANSALRSAVLAWQWARSEGLVPSAAEAGWARLPDPTRPKGRGDN